MPKKRKFSYRNRRRTATDRKEGKTTTQSQFSLSRSILSLLAKTEDPLSTNAIRKNLASLDMGKKAVEATLAELVRRGEVIAAGKKGFRLDLRSGLFIGRIEKHPRGFGFVVDLQPADGAASFGSDPYLSMRNIGTANHGDTVLIRVTGVDRSNRPEAELVAILERFAESITGFYRDGLPPRVIPEDPRYPGNIIVTESVQEQISDNQVVVVKILPSVTEEGFVRGRITEVLGPLENIDVQMRMVIEKHSLPFRFPAEVEEEAAALSADSVDSTERMDLRKIGHVTIDGRFAKDFDDAIAVEKTKKGFRLYVSIADVSSFVRPGSALDKEAYLRGTSIYFPGRVIPMLPEKLSNDLCSLLPDVERLTFSAILDFDHRGELLAKKFTKSIIKSRQRFTYSTVKKILIDKDQEIRSQHQAFLTALELAEELATHLHARRMERGSIGFNLPEPEIFLEEDGKIRTIRRKERNFAHQIIEEFMLAANEAVATSFTEKKLPFLYRIHEKPAPEKVEEFASFAESLGLDLPKTRGEPDWFAEVLQKVAGTPREYVVNNLLLRTMQQARYDPENAGHFGLAASDYTHFTSPIRRYPDLVVHRFLQAMLVNKPGHRSTEDISLKEMAKHLSDRERAAVNAERDIVDRLKIFFMEPHIGATFEAVISGVSDKALFVELTDLFISGSIDIRELQDDYYLYDEKRYRLIGEITGKTYQLGDVVSVVLLDVDYRRKRINFSPQKAEQEPESDEGK